VGDNSEEFDENNNPVLNPANINRGANHLAEGQTAESLIAREKTRLSVENIKNQQGRIYYEIRGHKCLYMRNR
jgi:hypothetical protein